MRRFASLLAALFVWGSLLAPAQADVPGASGAPAKPEEVARAYWSVWELDGRRACLEKRSECEGMELVLSRAARAFDRAGKRSEAIAAWRALVDARYGLEAKTEGRLALLELGHALVERTAYEEAADCYRRFAHTPKASSGVAFALGELIQLEMTLGNTKAALEEFTFFQDKWADANVTNWSDLGFSLYLHLEAREEWAAGRDLMSGFLGARDRISGSTSGKPNAEALREIELRARARLARAHAKLGETRAAIAGYKKVVAAAGELGVWPGKKKETKQARTDDTLDAIGEAFFALAEEKRLEAERIVLEPYTGKGDRDSVMLYHQGPVARWLERRRRAIEQAERAYVRVFGALWPEPPPPPPPPPPTPGLINIVGGDPNAPLYMAEDDPISPDYSGPPFPSLRFALLAAERIGAMWADYVKTVRSLPIPREWERIGLFSRNIYTAYSPIDPIDEVFKHRAKKAFQACLRLSTTLRIVNESTRKCESWLARNYRAEYFVIEEFTGTPTWSKADALPLPAPLRPNVLK